MKKHFFKEIGKALVFDKVAFQSFVSNKQFLPDSYTALKNKIGLTADREYLTESKEVVLSWAYKDCVLEGGQTKEDQKRKEIFWNETLAPDEIDRLLAPKALGNFKKYYKDGEHEVENISLNDNLIIKGNNLLALHSLKKKYAGKVKLIYIDPPYNTGNDGFGYNDSFNHSTWLTFMKNRLEVAKELLKDDGVIFISCDDNEQAYLKLLMDEIYGRVNFIANIIAQTNPRGRTLDKFLAKTYEYILVYSLKPDQQSLFEIPKSEKRLKEYRKKDNDGQFRELELRNRNPAFNRENRPNLFYSIFVNPNPNKVSLNKDKDKDYSEEALPQNSKMKDGCWTWGRTKVEENIGLLIGRKTSTGIWRVYRKDYIPEGGAYTKEKSLWIDKNINHENGKEELGKLFGETPFSFPKSVDLIKKCLKIGTKYNENHIILDFHAGSGTTAQAVVELNEEDNGNRSFILCEQMNYIQDITVERIKIFLKNEAIDSPFIYCELTQYNANIIDKIEQADTTEALKPIWQEIEKTDFISYKIKPETINENIHEFESLTIEEQKQFLIAVLDKNQLYVNYSEIEDEDYLLSEDDKKLNRQFYGEV
ncbi:restriction endonuclease subunit M [Methylococcaceae bacterium CS2]|nr:restriction endonuclease subunit M [Methylococcaceae bacterium CS2]